MSKLAHRFFSFLLQNRFGSLFEKILVFWGHRFPFFKFGKRAIIDSLICRHRGDLSAKIDLGAKMTVPKTVEGCLYYLTGKLDGRMENESVKLMSNTLNDNSIFFDLGANFGYFSLVADKIIKTGRIYAFEPQKEVLKFLEKSVKNLPKIVLEKTAVSDKEGKTNFYFSLDGENVSLPSLLPHPWLSGKRCQVKTIKLDDYIKTKKIHQIDLIKMDIEGAEIMALKGLKWTLKHISPKMLIIEALSEKLASEPQKSEKSKNLAKTLEIVDFLDKFDYKPYQITSSGRIGAIYTKKILKNINWTINIAFIKN